MQILKRSKQTWYSRTSVINFLFPGNIWFLFLEWAHILYVSLTKMNGRRGFCYYVLVVQRLRSSLACSADCCMLGIFVQKYFNRIINWSVCSYFFCKMKMSRIVTNWYGYLWRMLVLCVPVIVTRTPGIPGNLDSAWNLKIENLEFTPKRMKYSWNLRLFKWLLTLLIFWLSYPNSESYEA